MLHLTFSQDDGRWRSNLRKCVFTFILGNLHMYHDATWWISEMRTEPYDFYSRGRRVVKMFNGTRSLQCFNHFATMALCSGPHCECVGSDSPLQRAKPILGNFGIKLGFLSNSTYLAAILFFLVTMATYQTLEGSKRISYLYTFKITMGW